MPARNPVSLGCADSDTPVTYGQESVALIVHDGIHSVRLLIGSG